MADNTLGQLGELIPTAPAEIEKQARAVAQLGAELRAGRQSVFFYAASGFDWQPLHRFSHLFDCFVYVDPRYRDDEFEQARQQLVGRQTIAGNGLSAVDQILHIRAAYDTLTEATGQLAVMRNEMWTRIPNLLNRQPWGAVQRLQRHVGGTSKDIWLVFISGSPLVAYQQLFTETNTAPDCLAILKPEFPDPAVGHVEAMENLWGPFAGWNGELGHLIRNKDASLLPRLLVANELMAWPAHSTHYVVPNWRNQWKTSIHKMTNDPWPDLVPNPRAGVRRVVVTRKPINPHHATAVGAVVVTSEKYHHYRWPADTLVIVSAPPLYPEHAVPDGPGVVNVNIEGVPLLQALARVEAVCAEHSVTTVAVQRLPGYEDEAADLALWRQQEGQIKELIVHLNCDGHLLDYGQVADEIG